MSRVEALAILGLDESASRADIEAAWRTEIKNVHPDAGLESDADAVVRIMDARRAALSTADMGSTELVPAGLVTDLVKVRQYDSAQKTQASEKAMRGVVMHHVGTLAFRRRQRTILAGASAGIATMLALLTALLRASPDFDSETQSLFGAAAGVFALIAAAVGLLAWRVATLERGLQMELDDVAETLSDRAALSDAMNEIGLGSFFTRAQLHDAIRDWAGGSDPDMSHPRLAGFFGGLYRSVPLASTAGVIGPIDFGKLLVTKGVEVGLLSETERPGPDGSVTYGFSRT